MTAAVIIDLGAGDAPSQGAIAFDRRMRPTTRVVGDVRALPFRTGVADVLVSHHCLEHLSRDEGREALAEWLRVLKPSGILEIAVPDLEACARTVLRGIASKNDALVAQITANIYGGQSYAENFHKWGYTLSTLTQVLHTAGFATVTHLVPSDVHEVRVTASRG